MIDLTARRSEFHGHNLFFLALLGLLSTSARAGTLLARHGRTATAADVPVAVDDDPLLAAALGAIALRERLLLHASTALTAPGAPTTSRDGEPTPALRTLLR